MKFIEKLVFFIAAMTCCSCAARAPESESAMIKHEIRVGDLVYSFRVPKNESRDFPAQKTFSAFDFSSGDVAHRREGFMLMEKFWDYKNYRLGLNKDGTLIFSFRARQFQNGFRFDKSNPRALEKYLLEELQNAYGPRNAKHLENDNERLIVSIPSSVESVDFGGRSAFHYKVDGGSDFEAFVIPVSDMFFVQIQFGFIDNSLGRGLEWRSKAQSDADSIRSSMSILKTEPGKTGTPTNKPSPTSGRAIPWTGKDRDTHSW
jgi:hypothetical protein